MRRLLLALLLVASPAVAQDAANYVNGVPYYLSPVPFTAGIKILEAGTGPHWYDIIVAPDLSADVTITLPSASGTLALTSALAGYVQLQATTPGTAETGNTNVSGTAKSGTVITSSLTVNGSSSVRGLNSQLGYGMSLAGAAGTVELQGDYIEIDGGKGGASGGGDAGYGGRLYIDGGDGGNSANSASAGDGGYIQIQGGDSGSSSSTGNGAAGGYVSILGGNSINKATSTAGSVSIDAGTKAATATAGDVNIGATNAANIKLAGGYGSTGVTVTSAGNVSVNGTLAVDGIATVPTITSPALATDINIYGFDSTAGDADGGYVNITGGAAHGSGTGGVVEIVGGVMGATGTNGTVKIGSVQTLETQIAGGYGSTGVTVSDAGAISANGALKSDTSLVLQEVGGTTDTVTISVPSIASSYSLVLPADDGTPSQFLQTNGSGTLSWASVSGSVTLQGSTPGTADTGNANISGTMIAGTYKQPSTAALAITAAAPAQTPSSGPGNAVGITASNAVAGSANDGAAAGANVNITSGNAARLNSGNANGGDIVLTAGSGIGTGKTGMVQVADKLVVAGTAQLGSAKLSVGGLNTGDVPGIIVGDTRETLSSYMGVSMGSTTSAYLYAIGASKGDSGPITDGSIFLDATGDDVIIGNSKTNSPITFIAGGQDTTARRKVRIGTGSMNLKSDYPLCFGSGEIGTAADVCYGRSSAGIVKLQDGSTGTAGLSGGGNAATYTHTSGISSAFYWTPDFSGSTSTGGWNAMLINPTDGSGSGEENLLNLQLGSADRFRVDSSGATYTKNTITASTTTANSDKLAIAGNATGAATYTATLQPADLTANRTITVPNATGTLLLAMYGGMYQYTGVAATVIGTNAEYYALTQMVTGLQQGFTFIAGVGGGAGASITSVADAGSGKITVNATGTWVTGQPVTIHGTTDYDGTYLIVTGGTNTFTVTKTYTSTRTGVARGACALKADAGSGGVYEIGFTSTQASASNSINWHAEIVINTTAQDHIASRAESSTNSHTRNLSGIGHSRVADGDMIWMQIYNDTDASNITVTCANVTVKRIGS